LESSGEEHDGTLLDDGENDEGDELDEPEVLEYNDKPALVKSGPKELAAFHADLQKDVQEVVRKRGRPRKNPVDPLTVNTLSTAF
jgi:hypothetical protein